MHVWRTLALLMTLLTHRR